MADRPCLVSTETGTVDASEDADCFKLQLDCIFQFLQNSVSHESDFSWGVWLNAHSLCCENMCAPNHHKSSQVQTLLCSFVTAGLDCAAKMCEPAMKWPNLVDAGFILLVF